MLHIRKALVIACSLASVGGVAHAEDHAVVRRISSHGRMTSSHAKQLASKVSERMARAADAPPAMMEPLRAAMSQALLGTPMPPDGISAAKVRLKLYAGLNEFALEAMFAPRPGAIAGCQRDLDLAQKECEALVAAAGEISVTQAKRSGGGPATPPVAMAPMRGAPQMQGQGRPMQSGSRFGGQYNAGYAQPRPPTRQQGYAQPQNGSRFGGGGAQPSRFGAAAPVAQQQPARFGGAAPAAQPQPSRFGAAAPVAQQQPSRFGGRTPPQQSRFGGAAPVQAAPAAAPAYVAAAPAPAPAPAPTLSAADAAARKEAYLAQRQAYLARKKQEFEERRAKTLGVMPAPAEPPAEAPKVAEAPKKAEPAPEPEPETPLEADMKAAVGSSAETPNAGAGKAGLDGDFLDGLLDDPLGGTKKK